MSGRPRGFRRKRTYGNRALVFLRKANPVDEGAILEEGKADLEAILSQPVPPRPPNWRLWAVVVSIASIAATSAVAFLGFEPQAVGCYQDVNLEASIVLDVSAAEPLAACAKVWAEGKLTSPAFPDRKPPLYRCVRPGGGIAVFPTDDSGVCQRLGLDEFGETEAARAKSTKELTAALVDYLLAGNCRSIDDAADGIRNILDDSGFKDWKIISGVPTTERPCASFGIESQDKTIRLVPIPPSPPTTTI